MPRIAEFVDFLESFAPVPLAEDWDNVGLLIGNRERDVSAAMTCLTLTPDVADEAVREKAQLVVSHHPVLFRPTQRLTADDAQGRMLLQLIESGVAVYSPHTGYDSAAEGINHQLAEALELKNIGVLRPAALDNGDVTPSPQLDAAHAAIGGGRFGSLSKPIELSRFVEVVAKRLGSAGIQYVGDAKRLVQTVAVACGSAAEFLTDAQTRGCDVLVTGEARFHACLEARTAGIALILAGHYATERPGVERLAAVLGDRFSDVRVWASGAESDPIQWA